MLVDATPAGDAAVTEGRRGRAQSPVLAGAPPAPPAALPVQVWEQLGLICSANERRADEASRDVEAWLKCQYMRERVGEQFAGRVTGVAPFGVFVTLNELYVDGLVHVSELGAEYFQYNEAAHELRGERTGRRFRLTDELHVQVSRVDLEARRIEFRLVPRVGFREVVAASGAAQPGRCRRFAASQGAPPKTDRANGQRRATRPRGWRHRAAGGQPRQGRARAQGRRQAQARPVGRGLRC